MSGAAPQTGEPSRRFFVLRVLGTVLSLVLLVYLIQAQGWGEFRDVMRRVSWWHLVLAVLLIIGSRVCTTLRWLVLLRYANAKINFWQALRLIFVGNFASNFLPSTVGGDFVRLAGTIQLGVDPATSAASLVVDRLVGMAGMASLSPFGLFLLTRASGVAQAVQGLAVLGMFAGMGQRIDRLPVIGPILRKAKRFFHNLVQHSIGWFHRPAGLLLALFFTFGHMLFTFLTIWVLLGGMHQSISLWWVGALWSLSYFVSLVPFSINGLGLQEVSITVLYSQFGGVSMESALALAVLTRMLFLLASLPGALFVADILRPRKNAVTPETGDSSTSSSELL